MGFYIATKSDRSISELGFAFGRGGTGRAFPQLLEIRMAAAERPGDSRSGAARR
jgi:hypothetical protein